MKTSLTLLTALLIIFPYVGNSQTKPQKVEKDNYSITLSTGIANSTTNTNTGNTSGIVGLRVSYDVNDKLSLGSDVGYNKIQNAYTNSATLLQMTYGPRYYINVKELKSAFFFDVSMGGYMYATREENPSQHTSDATSHRDLSASTPSSNKVNLGLSGSIGGEMYVSKAFGITVRGRYHTIFEGEESTNFYTLEGGVKVNL